MPPVRNLGPLTRESFGRYTGLNPAYYPMVAPGRSRTARLRRWIARKLWHLTKKTLRRGVTNRRILLPWYIAAAAWLTSAAAGLIQQGCVSVAVLGVLGAVPLWWRLGAPLGRWTRRRGLKPREQRVWFAAAYTVLVALSLATAAGNLAPPMPGLWLGATFAVWIRWMWHHRTRPAAPVSATVAVDGREQRWTRIAASGKPLAGSVLEGIRDLQNPNRWTTEIDLPSGDLTVDDVMRAHLKIASLFSVRRDSVIVDYAPSGAEDRAVVTVVLDNPCHGVIEYDETWPDLVDGCVPFHTYPDGFKGWLRLWLPGSGTCHSFFSGDSRSGKSSGIEAGLTQAVMTGKVWPMVGDPQGGQSLPAWCRADGGGAARSQATEIPAIYEQLVALRDAMLARSRALSRMVWEDDDGEHVGLSFFDPDVTGWPVILYVLEEAHLACKDPDYGELILELVEAIVKMAGKTGIILWIANQYPGIEELGNKMAIKQNLMAGNTLAYRNSATSVKQMVLPSHMPSPFDILPETPTGEHTKGTASIYSAAPRSSRATYSRSVWVRRAHYWAGQAQQRIPDLDPAAGPILARVAGQVLPPAAEEPSAAAQHVPQEASKRKETVLVRILAYLAERPDSRAHTGVIADALAAPKSTVSTTLGRAEKTGKVHQVRPGIWALGARPAQVDQEAAA